MASETASKPAGPRSKGGAATGARATDGAAKPAVREKLRVRERQTAMLVGQLAAQLEDKQPGRIFAVKLTCTRYKSTGTIVFNQRRVRAPTNERDAGDDSDDDDDSDDEGGAGSGPGSGPPVHTVAASKPAGAAAAKTAAAGTADAAKQRDGRGAATSSPGGWQLPRRPAKQQPQQQPKQQKADRNAISARGQGQLQPGQLSAIANSVSATSREVCPWLDVHGSPRRADRRHASSSAPCTYLNCRFSTAAASPPPRRAAEAVLLDRRLVVPA